jgi:hypothetical protein
VNGCGSLGFDGATVTIKDHTSGTTLATVTTNSVGVWTASVAIATNPQSLDIVASPAGTYAARFTGTASSTISAARGTNLPVTLTLSPDTTTYHCTSFRFYPIKLTLQLVDSVNGTPATFNFDVGSGAWIGSIGLAYPGCPASGCPPAAVSAYDYSLAGSGILSGAFATPTGIAVCPGSGGFLAADFAIAATITDLPFTATVVVPANSSTWYCASSATITITEI